MQVQTWRASQSMAHDVCQNDTGGVSGGYGSVECRRESGSTATRGVSRAQMHGHMKADDDDMRVRMSGHVNSVGRVTDAGGGLSGRRKRVEMEESGCV